jgi:hypothetical protein
VLDRVVASAVAVGFFCGPTLGVILLWRGGTGVLALAAACFVGLGMGAGGEMLASLVSRYVGLCAFGEIDGSAVAACTLGGVAGPLLMGMGCDATGSYGPVLRMFVVATLRAAGLMTRLGPYRVVSHMWLDRR